MLWLPPFISLQWSTGNIYVTSDNLQSSITKDQLRQPIKSNKYVSTQRAQNFTIDSCLFLLPSGKSVKRLGDFCPDEDDLTI